jgi:hypothetical protein
MKHLYVQAQLPLGVVPFQRFLTDSHHGVATVGKLTQPSNFF